MKHHGLRPVSQSARTILEQLIEGLDELGASKKVDNADGALMGVCVGRVEETVHGPIYSVAHYFEQNGDLVRDPDVTLCARPTASYQDGRVYRLSAELGPDGSVRADRDRQADLAHFVGGWMRNIKAQQGL